MRDLYIVSDLHLSEGPKSMHEDFFADTQFIAFLKQVHKESPKATLLLNGDIVDFLQVTTVDKKHLLTTKNERTYGFGTDPEKSAWKLKRVINGHHDLFHALDTFAANGHKIHLIKGNHDPEWHWPLVQKTLLKHQRQGAHNLTFLPWCYHEPKRIYIEHGSQYDAFNSTAYWMQPILPHNPHQLVLPFGSMFVRYFINKVEAFDDLADNFRPNTAYTRYVLKHNPIKSIRVLWKYIPFLYQSIQKARRHSSRADWLALKQQHESLRDTEAKRWNLTKRQAAIIDGHHKRPVLDTHNTWQRIVFEQEDATTYHHVAEHLRALLHVPLVSFGHTHFAEQRQGYLNTGTWTEVLSQNKEGKLVQMEPLTYAVVKGMKAQLKVWQ